MRVFIVGAGETGTHLAKLISQQEHHDVILMDEDPDKVDFAYDNSLEIMPIVGNPTSIRQLKHAGVEETDLFVAVTPSESANILSCMIAHRMGVKKTLARVSNYDYFLPQYLPYFNGLGVDEMVYPEALAAQEIYNGLRLPWTRQYWRLFGGRLHLCASRITKHSPMLGKRLMELSDLDEKHFHIISIVRGRESFVPRGNDTLEVNDIVYVACNTQNLDTVREYCGQPKVDVRKVIIMGGSRIALRTAELLPHDMSVKIIERDLEKCRELSEVTNDNTLVIHGDAADSDLLISEGIRNTQAFLALTGSSEINMIATMNAKHLGIPRTVAEIENVDYLDIASQLGIGNIVNKKIIAASKIIRHLHRIDISDAKTMAIGHGDVLEIVITEGSRITKAPIKDLKIPRSITLGGFLRDGEVYLVEGHTVLKPGDTVLVFNINARDTELDDLFK